jgi:RNA polymerase sigma factor (sigma-70 family)
MYTVEQGLKDNIKFAKVMCYRFTYDSVEVELLKSEAMERAWRYKHKFEGGPSEFKAWLYIILRNTFIDMCRRKKNLGFQISIDDDDQFNHPSEEIDIENKIDNSRLIDNITYTVEEHFGEKYATIFRLYVFDNLKHKDIAIELGIPHVSVRVIMHRIREHVSDSKNIMEKPIKTAC